jgi:hypothetical protein
MSHAQRRTTPLAACAMIAVSIAVGAQAQVSKRDAESLQQKVAAITIYAEQRSTQLRRTAVTEKELNAYLAYDAASQLPPGVVTPTLTIQGSGRVSGRAVVDLDAVRKQKNPTSLLDPMYYLSGQLPVTAAGVLKTSAGVGRFTLESATVGGIPIPKIVLQEIVSHYSRSPENPEGIVLDDPFPLPANIREIQVDRGQAIIIQ